MSEIPDIPPLAGNRPGESAVQSGNCPEFLEKRLKLAIAGRLPEDLWELLANHVSNCTNCKARFETALAMIDVDPRLVEIFERTPDPETDELAAKLIAIRPRAVEFEPGEFIGPYQVVSRLGKGGFSTVYDCFDAQLSRRVAVKVLTNRKFDDSQLNRLEQEARLLARLDHPGIVRAYEFEPFHDPPFIVMERVAGGTARDLLIDGPVAPRLAGQLLENVARALDHAHRQGVIHRDIKPSNLLVIEHPEASKHAGSKIALKLTDFGLAKPLETNSSLTLSDALIGTPAYMSPEQTRGKAAKIDLRSDIYSLGVVLYEFLIGKPPLVSDNVALTIRMISEQEPVPPRRILRQIPRDLETICLKCLRKQPDERYASALELAQDLTRFLEGRPILARPIGPIHRLYRWCNRNRPLAASLGIVVSLLALLGALTINFAIVQKDLREKAEASAREARQAAFEAGVESDSTRNRMFSSVQQLTQIANELTTVRNHPDALKLAEKAQAFNRQTIETYMKRPFVEKGITGVRIDIFFRDAMAMRELGFPKVSLELLERIFETAEKATPGDSDYFALISAGNRTAPPLIALLQNEIRNDEARSVLIDAWRIFRLDLNRPELTLMNVLERRALLELLLRTPLDPPDDKIIEQAKAEIVQLINLEYRFAGQPFPSN